MSDIYKNEEVARLRWSCRRGMLELDLLLRGFLDDQYLTLNPEEQQEFQAFLSCSDPDLFAWLLGSKLPADREFLPLIKKIRAYARLGTPPQAL